MTRQLIS